MQNFKDLDLEMLCELFSKGRILSYDSINQHFDNLALIGQISKSLGIAEVLLRNKIDFVMSERDALWLESLPQDLHFEAPKDLNATRDKIISIQSLGFWVKVVDFYRIHDKILCKDFLDSLDFKRYYAKNQNRFKNKANLQNYHKVRLLLHLLRNLRNRAFHFENLYKLNDENKPRLMASIKNKENALCVINLETSKIKLFLKDLISELMKKENGGKASPKNERIMP